MTNKTCSICHTAACIKQVMSQNLIVVLWHVPITTLQPPAIKGDTFLSSFHLLSDSTLFVFCAHLLVKVKKNLYVQNTMHSCICWVTEKKTSVGPTVFRKPRNFKPSRGIWPLTWNFRVFAEFHGILRKHGNSAATAKFRKAVLLL